MWGQMRMSAADLADVSGDTYTYLMNGRAPAGNWTGLFTPGERVRLRFINGSAMTYFDVRIPGVKMTVVAADGQPVRPVTVDEFRIAVAETFDVIVEPAGQEAFTIFAQAMDRTGFAAGTLAVRERPARGGARARCAAGADDGRHGPWRHGRHGGDGPRRPLGHDMAADAGGHACTHPANRAGQPAGRHADDDARRRKLDDPGIGLRDNGRRVLTYADLKSMFPDPDGREPGGTIELHLTGHMERFAWSFNGVKFSERRADAADLRRARAHRAGQRHDDDAPHPPARHVERPRGRRGQFKVRKHTIDMPPGTSAATASRPTRSAAGRITATCCSTWKRA